MLNNTQIQNAQYLKSAMTAEGITNPFVQSAILGVVYKESGLVPKSELSYKNTNNDQIRKTFANARIMSDAELNKLKQDSVAFFNKVYNLSVLGNSPSDGYKYRGGGYNQLTGKSNYSAYAKLTGVDIVTNPEKINEPDTAAKVAIAYFKRGVERGKASGALKKYNATDINDFKNNSDAYDAIYQINAGKLGRDLSFPSELIRKGYERGKSALSYFNANIVGVVDIVKKNIGKTIAIVLILGLGITAIVLYNKK